MTDRNDREREAVVEMAATRVGRAGAVALVALLALVLGTGVVAELVRVGRGTSRVFPPEPAVPGPATLFRLAVDSGPKTANRELRAALAGLEDRAGRESAISARLRPDVQRALVRFAGYGNSQVLVGAGRTLYFATAFSHLVGRPFLDPHLLEERRERALAAVPRFDPDPVPGLVALRDALAARGIAFLFVPVPVKAAIEPEPLVGIASATESRFAGPLDNASTATMLERLAAAGVATYDPAADLREAALAGEDVFLATDTHWTPAGMRIAARGAARAIRAGKLLAEIPPTGLERAPFPYEFAGDLVALLGLGEGDRTIARERVVLDAVRAPGGGPLDGSRGASGPAGSGGDPAAGSDSPAPALAPARVLLLGDSYSVVFAFDRANGAAGFGDQLAYELDRPVRVEARTAANELPARVRWLRDDPALLDGIELVVYEVTARALSTTDWQITVLEPEPRPDGRPKPRRKKRR